MKPCLTAHNRSSLISSMNSWGRFVRSRPSWAGPFLKSAQEKRQKSPANNGWLVTWHSFRDAKNCKIRGLFFFARPLCCSRRPSVVFFVGGRFSCFAVVADFFLSRLVRSCSRFAGLILRQRNAGPAALAAVLPGPAD